MTTFDKTAIAMPGQAWKQPNEVLDLAVDFVERLTSATITVGSVTAVELPDEADASAAIIETSPAPFVQPLSKAIQFRLKAGEAGKDYKVTVIANGADGQVAEYDLVLHILEY